MMLGVEPLRCLPRGQRLAEIRLAEGDGEAFDSRLRNLARKPRHRGRIDPSGEEHGNRNVAHEMISHRVAKRVANTVNVRRKLAMNVLRRSECSDESFGLARHVSATFRTHFDNAPGRHAHDALDDRQRLGNGAGEEIRRNCCR